MIENPNFPFKKLVFLSISLLGMCFWAGDSMAQAEHEKSEMEFPKPVEKPISENHSDLGDVQIHENLTPATTITTAPASLPKKETQTSGEGKKVEPTPSTLSFNIFLYIVDKFKAN